jgi:hypothetical protein
MPIFWSAAVAILMTAIVFRGYFQGSLERSGLGAAAILCTANGVLAQNPYEQRRSLRLGFPCLT